MKKLYLIHGWGGSSKGGWFDVLKDNLRKNKVKVISFDLPNTNYPKISEWISEMNKNIKEIDEETYLLGHSIGCLAILHFIGQLKKDVKIGGCIFIAGWFNLKEDCYGSDEEKDTAKPWIETKLDFKKIKKRCRKFLAIFSDDDPFVPLSDVDLFKEKLNADTIIQKGKGHFDTVKEFEEAYKKVVDFLLK